MNGQITFAGKLEECMENKSKSDYDRAPWRAVRDSATIGVLLNEYNQGTASAEVDANGQDSLRLHMIITSRQDPQLWDWECILEDLSKTYTLLREEVKEAKDKIQKELDESEKKSGGEGEKSK